MGMLPESSSPFETLFCGFGNLAKLAAFTRRDFHQYCDFALF